jgi:hypothetical protein
MFATLQTSAAEIDLETVTLRARKNNYTVLNNAQRLYQSKMYMMKSRTDLLPSLNLWRLLNNFAGGFQIDMVEDIAPFLIPANWFKMKENTLLHKVEKLGYRAFVANQVMNARSLYWKLLHDETVIGQIDIYVKELDPLVELVRTREDNGVIPLGTTRDLRIHQLRMKDDLHKMKLLQKNQLLNLTMALGFPSEEHHIVHQDELGVVETIKPIDYTQAVDSVLGASPELAQFHYMLKVLPKMKGEAYFSLLGAGRASRGLPGGVFDDLPSLDTFGFSNIPVINMIKAQKSMLLLQRDGVMETLKRQWQGNYNELEFGVLRKTDLGEQIRLNRESKDFILRKIQMGENVNMVDLLNTSRNLVESEIAYTALVYHLRSTLDVQERLQFTGPYGGI